MPIIFQNLLTYYKDIRIMMANIVRQERGNLSSMREVAELAGVSVSTVAAVINENKFVSPERKRRIEMAILQTGYRKRRA